MSPHTEELKRGKKKQKQTIITPFQVQVQTRSTVKGENSELTSTVDEKDKRKAYSESSWEEKN